jgi:hypothetical protein
LERGHTPEGRPYRVWVGGPVPPGADAITLGSLVLVRRRAAASAHLMRHEAAHVDQWARLGWIRFLYRYLAAYIRGRLLGHGHDGAYRRIPLEVEAEWRARTSGPGAPTLAGTARVGGSPR